MSKYYSSSIAFGAKQTKTEKVVVSPTKIGDVTTDAVSGALTVDEVPTLDSLNPVSSDGVARAVIQAGAELPTRGSSDTGKVLTVANSAGDLEWDTPEGSIPDMTGKNGKVLGAVDDNGTMKAQWVDQPTVPTLATVATTGSYDDLTNKPSIPAAQVNADWNAVSGVSQILNKPNLATVATTGSYSDLSNKPTIPTVPTTDQTYNASSTNPQSGTAVAGAIATVKQVPATAAADANKVLTVNAQGDGYEWVTAQGGGSSDVVIVEDSTTLGDVYTAYTSGKVLYYKASSGEMYYLSRDLSSGSGSSDSFNLAGTYTVIQWADSARIKTFTVYIALNGDQPLYPTTAFGDCILNIYTIDTQAPLPSKTGNADKILAVNSSATGLEWVAKPTSVTYTAGDGIDITSDVVSAKAGNGLSIGTSTKTGTVTEPKYVAAYTSGSLIVVDCAIPLTSDIITAIDNNETITVVVPQYVDPTTTIATWFQNTNRFVIGAHNNDSGLRAPLSAPAASYYGTFTLNKSNIPSDYLSNWDSVKASNTTMLEIMGCTSTSFNGWPGSAQVSSLGDYKVFDITMPKTTTIQNAINVDNPIPAYDTSADAGKALQVTSNGLAWINSVPIEVVASLPASPTAGTLYIVTGA